MPYSADIDKYDNLASQPSSPARKAAAVTPSDSTDLSSYSKALYIGSGGTVVLLPVGHDDGATVTFSGVVAGSILPIQARRILATGTTASSIISLFD